MVFDNAKALKLHLGLSLKRLKAIFTEKFLPGLMNEIIKQLKKSDSEVIKVQAPKADQETRTEAAEDDSDASEHEAEQEREVAEADGKIKLVKEARGYESEDSDASGGGSVEMAPEDEEPENLSGPDRFKQYLSNISFNEASNSAAVQITFPLEFRKVLLLTIVESTMAKVLVRSTPHIEKCNLVKPKEGSNDEPYLIVQGINFDAFLDHQDILDLDRLETNHSYALKNKYGVEAMRANIVKEIQMVFGVYGISVDPRHLSLIADFMTFNGGYRAFNRIGMEESSSPFLKMSFETTMKYLVNASVRQERDDMSSPSSAIVLGQVPRVGTGMFELLRSQEGLV